MKSKQWRLTVDGSRFLGWPKGTTLIAPRGGSELYALIEGSPRVTLAVRDGRDFVTRNGFRLMAHGRRGSALWIGVYPAALAVGGGQGRG